MVTYGFNISCSLGKQSNNMFYGFSSVKCATSGIFPVSRREKMKSTIFKNRLITTNRRISTVLVSIITGINKQYLNKIETIAIPT